MLIVGMLAASPLAEQWRNRSQEFALSHIPAFRGVNQHRWLADAWPLVGFRDPKAPHAVCAGGLCDGVCCLSGAVFDRLPHGLARTLRHRSNATVALFGNSVAMSNGFLSTKTAIAALGMHGVVQGMHMGYLPRKGGVDTSHAALCAGNVGADVVIIQYNSCTVRNAMRMRVQNLQRRRSPPIIGRPGSVEPALP